MFEFISGLFQGIYMIVRSLRGIKNFLDSLRQLTRAALVAAIGLFVTAVTGYITVLSNLSLGPALFVSFMSFFVFMITIRYLYKIFMKSNEPSNHFSLPEKQDLSKSEDKVNDKIRENVTLINRPTQKTKKSLETLIELSEESLKKKKDVLERARRQGFIFDSNPCMTQ